MLIWSIFDGGNYRYILEYGFPRRRCHHLPHRRHGA